MLNIEFCFKTAVEIAELIRNKEVSAVEVMEAHLQQIEAQNPQVNAIITLLPDLAMEKARAADAELAKGGTPGVLHGLPIAHKDLIMTKGILTTRGSTIFKDFVPDTDDILVERLRAAGAICIGKTNVPEFGAGSQTFNSVFGTTLNPYDISKTCGGSSGGAAVALACGMLPLADGSDIGGSLRNPASFCNIVGFRPSPGRVATRNLMGWYPIPVEGPMARTVKDVTLMLSAMSGPDPRDPISLSEPGSVFNGPLDRDFNDVRIGWSRDMGELPVEPSVTETIERQLSRFEELGCHIEEIEIDFTDADEVFKTLRYWNVTSKLSNIPVNYIAQLKEPLQREYEQGRKQSAEAISQAEIKRTQIFHRMRTLMERYEYLLFPVSQVQPFDINQEYVTEINGEKMDTYIDWMKSCYYISVTGHPAISVPCGFSPDGLPVGLQIIGRHQADFSVLQLAEAFEQSTGFWRKQPEMVKLKTRLRESNFK